MLFLVLFPTSLCGVLFLVAHSRPYRLLPPPHSHTTYYSQLTHTHNSLTHNLLTHNLLTHTQLTHTQFTHNLLLTTHSHTHNSLTHNRSDATQSAILRGRSGTRWQRCCLLISYAIWHLVALSSSMQARACLLFLDLLQTWSDGWLV